MSKRRPALGPVDFLDVAMGQAPMPSAAAASTRRPKAPAARPVNRSKPKPAPRPAGRLASVTFHLPPELLDEARNAVVALSGPPVRLTLARLVVEGLRRELARLQREHHQGKPWPRRGAELSAGRPIQT